MADLKPWDKLSDSEKAVILKEGLPPSTASLRFAKHSKCYIPAKIGRGHYKYYTVKIRYAGESRGSTLETFDELPEARDFIRNEAKKLLKSNLTKGSKVTLERAYHSPVMYTPILSTVEVYTYTGKSFRKNK
jgi:hypothetical protein